MAKQGAAWLIEGAVWLSSRCSMAQFSSVVEP